MISTLSISYHIVVLNLAHSMEIPTYEHVLTQFFSVDCFITLKVSTPTLYLLSVCTAIHNIPVRMAIIIWLPALANGSTIGSPLIAPIMSLYAYIFLQQNYGGLHPTQ